MQKKNHRGSSSWIGMCCAVLLAAACASTTPPQELVDARASFARAQVSQANQLKPELVYEAKKALDAAEKSYGDDAKSEKTRDLAYVALRKSQFAEAMAGAVAAEQQEARARTEMQQVQREELQKTRGQVQQTEQELAREKQALAGEKQARADAERRAKEAMDQLTTIQLTVKEEPRGRVITLPGDVFFTSGKSILLPGAQEKLNKVAEALKSAPDQSILVEGHTDSRGSESYNMELSQRRADAVRNYLASRDIPAEKMKTAGVGPSRPAADNSTAEGRATNRRVEIIVQGRPEAK